MRYKDRVVVRGNIRYLVRGHAQGRAVQRGLIEEDNSREMVNYLVDIYEENSEDIDQRLVCMNYTYIHISLLDENKINPYYMPIQIQEQGSQIIIHSIWTAQFYRWKVQRYRDRLNALQAVEDLKTQPIYCKV